MTTAPARPTTVVALDGPSGSGKSTVARRVASALGWAYLDTGATYRAATVAVLRAGVPLDDPAAVEQVVRDARITLRTDPSAPGVELDGVDVSADVRGPAVTAAVSAVSAVPAVRARLVALQQELIGEGRAVVEGRDICAVVAPAAAVKVYLDADPAVRAVRRAGDVDSGVRIDLAAGGTPAAQQPHGAPSGSRGPALHDGSSALTQAVAADLARRDALDSSRAASPLAAAPDAVVVDATHLGADEVVERVLSLAADAGWLPR